MDGLSEEGGQQYEQDEQESSVRGQDGEVVDEETARREEGVLVGLHHEDSVQGVVLEGGEVYPDRLGPDHDHPAAGICSQAVVVQALKDISGGGHWVFANVDGSVLFGSALVEVLFPGKHHVVGAGLAEGDAAQQDLHRGDDVDQRVASGRVHFD
jgi:hypothetical protein